MRDVISNGDTAIRGNFLLFLGLIYEAIGVFCDKASVEGRLIMGRG